MAREDLITFLLQLSVMLGVALAFGHVAGRMRLRLIARRAGQGALPFGEAAAGVGI
jgi:hypothetical protein